MCPNWAKVKVLDLDSLDGQKRLTSAAQIQQALRLIRICHSGSVAAHLLRPTSTKTGLMLILVPFTKRPRCGRTTCRHITYLFYLDRPRSVLRSQVENGLKRSGPSRASPGLKAAFSCETVLTAKAHDMLT